MGRVYWMLPGRCEQRERKCSPPLKQMGPLLQYQLRLRLLIL